MTKQQAAQNQHYVPKFILRKFLSNSKKEQVSVFQKSTRKIFSTSIANMMAERRFNEFRIDELYFASFEDSVCKVEDAVLPAYETLTKNQQLTGKPEERAMLGVFIAFQMLRTRAYRDAMTSTVDQFRDRIAQMGTAPDTIDELEQYNEDQTKESHMKFISESIVEFSQIISEKNFLLLRAPEARYFYLADNPVTLHNDAPRDGIWGNIGLAVKGIQIFVPLTSNLMLAAWCPSIISGLRERCVANSAQARRMKSTVALSPQPLPSEKRAEFDREINKLDEWIRNTEEFLQSANEGKPVLLTNENMDYYNSMQVQFAREFVICQHGDFELADRYVEERGAAGGWQFRVS